MDYKRSPRPETTPIQRMEEEDKIAIEKQKKLCFSTNKLWYRLSNEWKNNLVAKHKRKEERLE